MSRSKAKKDPRSRKELIAMVELGHAQYRQHCEEIKKTEEALDREIEHSQYETKRADNAEIELVKSNEGCMDLRLALCKAKRIISAMVDASVNYVVRTHKETEKGVTIREVMVIDKGGSR